MPSCPAQARRVQGARQQDRAQHASRLPARSVSRAACRPRKRVYGPKGASWGVSRICRQHVLRDPGRRGQQN
eukprot:4786106-Prymnesium_polylepis.2